MNEYRPLNLSYKGDRDYLHGSDIITAIFTNFPDIKKNISIKFHKTSFHPIFASYINASHLSELKKSTELNAILSYRDETDCIKIIAITEDTSKEIKSRKEFEENLVTKGYKIMDSEIFQYKPIHGNFIERVIALYKELLRNTVSKGPWLFVRIDLDSYKVNSKSISIKIVNEIGGNMFKASITTDYGLIGSIYFIKGPK